MKTELYLEKADCCGCGACMNICKIHAIEMKPDENGFLYPKIDFEKCINCGQCKKVCLYQNFLQNNFLWNHNLYMQNQQFVSHHHSLQ